MRTRVVCISRTLAAGGERIGHLVADRLGFRYFDEEVIVLASERAGLDPAIVGDAEKRSSLLTRLMDALTALPKDVESPFPGREDRSHYPVETRQSMAPPRQELLRLIQEAVREIARRGNAVIVAHAASMVLGNQKDVLRALVTASPRTRAQRLALRGAASSARRLPRRQWQSRIASADCTSSASTT
jgi:hypothetical protein